MSCSSFIQGTFLHWLSHRTELPLCKLFFRNHTWKRHRNKVLLIKTKRITNMWHVDRWPQFDGNTWTGRLRRDTDRSNLANFAYLCFANSAYPDDNSEWNILVCSLHFSSRLPVLKGTVLEIDPLWCHKGHLYHSQANVNVNIQVNLLLIVCWSNYTHLADVLWKGQQNISFTASC